MSKGTQKKQAEKKATAAAGEGPGGSEYPVIVAGIGVGAGGAKSLRQFLGKIPTGLGIAYVLVLHPGPSKKILSIRRLGNLTALEVVEATEGMPVLADRIHVMPADRFLNITGSRLTLHKPVQCDGMWMPIDHFLCTLARDFRRRSCGVVLSGEGSDGTLGLSEIKAFGGRALVEEPGSAEFPEMPQGAIDAGVADAVLAAGAMAGAIAAMAGQAQEEMRRNQPGSGETHADLQDILNILRAKIGYDFSGYKPNTLVRRIRRRMALGRHASYADYAGFLNGRPEEVGLLQKDLLIGVTEFFRQPQAWETLGSKVIASIVEDARPGSMIRVWVPGCSTGQEAYSLAMVLSEQVKKSGKKVGTQIFATDADLSALATARSGSYLNEEIGQAVSAERLKRFFERKDGRYQVLKQIREQIVFAPQNLTADPPFSKLDLISCRNLLMYLEQPVQQKIIVLFHFALRNGGFLFLGTAESTGDREDLFDPVSKKWRIYRRIGIGRPAGIEIPVRPPGECVPSTGIIPVTASAPRLTLASAAQQMLLDRFAPACVMIDRKLQVLYVHGKVEDYLTFPTGELTTRIVDMAREGLRARLRGAIGKCLEMTRSVSVIARVRRGEKSVPVKATVSPLRHPRETDGLLLVTFEDHRLPALKSGRLAARESDVQQLSDELKVTREELQSTIEQLESSNDQLKASNEEVTASNEELQSANEELETSKEELQSLNEELNTINARLQEKVGELEGSNNDVLNLLASTAIATVFLDKELRVKRFTPASTRLLSLIASDLGRPVADVLRRFADEMLFDDARRVLTELTPLAKEVQAEDGRWYFRRITPYRTQDDRIEGVVLTFVDVSDIKQAEQALRASEKKYRDLVESANSIVIRWKPDGEITYVNRYGLSFFGYREEEILGRNAMILVPDQDSSGQDLTGLTAAIVEHPEQYVSNENENVLADGRRVWVQWTNRAILDEAGNVREILAIGNDVTERKRAEEALRLAHTRMEWLARFPEENPNPVLRVSAEGEALYCNPAAAKLDGLKCEIGRPTPDPVLPLVRQAMAEGREVMQDVSLGDRTYFVAVTSFPAEGYANVYGRDITERKRAEEVLQTTLQRFYTVLSSMHSAILLVTDEGRVEYANQAFCDYFELPDSPSDLRRLNAHEVIDRIRNAFLHPDEAIARITQILGQNQPVTGEEVAMRGQRTCLRNSIPLYVDGKSQGRLWHYWDITERKRAEEALQQSRERLDLALSSSAMATFEWDIVEDKRTWSEGVHSLLGSKPETFTGAAEEFFQVIHPEDRGAVQADLARAVESTGLYETEYRAVWPDGSIRYIAARGRVHRDSEGRAVSMTGVCWNVTERRQAEEELRESETKYRNLFENITEEVHFWKLVRDASGRITTWRLVDANPPTLKTWGKTLDEIKGKTTDEIFGPGASEHYMPVVRKIMEEGVPYGFEDYFPHLDKYFRFTSVPLGEYFITTGSDITGLKKIEQSLRQSREDLDRAQAVGQIGSWRLDVRRNILTWSDENHRIFGVPRGTPMTYETFLETIHPDDRRYVDTRWKAGLAGEPYDIEHRLVVEGQVKWVREKAYLEFDDAGNLLGGFGITQDITERKRTEEELRLSEEKFAMAFAMNPAAVVMTRVEDGVFLEVNEAFVTMFGFSREEAIGHSTLKLPVWPTPEDRARLVQELREKGFYRNQEQIMVRKSGARFTTLSWAALTTFAGEKIILSTWLDISDRKRAEQALQTTVQRFYNVLSGMYAAVLLVGDDGQTEFANQAFCDMFHLKDSPAELMGIASREMLGKIKNAYQQPEKAVARIMEIVRLGEPVKGEEVTMSGGNTCLRDFIPISVNGTSYGRLWHHLDITERKRAEVALQEARRRLEVIVDSIADGFYALDREWRFTHVNDAALRHMGKPREEILGRTLFDVYPAARNTIVETEYARAMETGQPRHFENLSLITGEGMLEIHAYPGSDNLTILFRDVTEKNRMVAALRESQEALQLANDYLEQRVRERTIDLQNLTEQLEGSRHELRKLASELVMAEERERKRIAGVLHDDIAQILATVRMRLDLLEGVPSDQKDKTLQEAKALLMQSIQETRALMTDIGNPLLFDMGLKPACESLAKRLMERHPVRIRCDIKDTYKHLDPDVKTILYQVVRELLNNVVKHSQAQNAHVLIDMEDGQFSVKVTDDGAGFDPQALGAPTAEGGFGLYSIRERLIAIDGSLRIESTPGTGTSVTAILPAALN